jgi:large subunit ribosomal protein L23
MIEPVSIIKKQIISEKAVKGAEKNTYVFKVDKESNKISIRQAIEAAYKGVKVAWVHTLRTPEKAKRILTRRGGKGLKQGFKKAIVCLKEGKIENN